MDRFDELDTNGDGLLSAEEAMAGVECLTQAQFDELDFNGNGTLSPPELRTFLRVSVIPDFPLVDVLLVLIFNVVLSVRELFRMIFFGIFNRP
ncbi:MAG: hypothetical protein HYZ00_04990 [Candidatus Hydrogenedentes bacterium]|nr:hypothetical protein [Candidatus Hydrogenedentota bacterium]